MNEAAYVEYKPERPGRVVPLLQVKTVADALATPSREYLVKGLLYAGDLSVTHGEPGCGKSNLWLHIGYRLSQGQAIFGRRVRPCPVLYLALEGAGSIAKRIQGVSQTWGMAEQFFYIAQPLNLFDDSAAMAGLIDAMHSHEIKALIVDTHARAIHGGDENASADTGRMIGNYDQIRHQTGAHVAVVHHGTKSGDKGPRGHSSLMGAIDLNMEVTNADGVRTVAIRKARDDDDSIRLSFALRPVEIGVDQDGDVLTTVVVEEDASLATGRRPTAMSPTEKIGMDALLDALIEQGEPSPKTTGFPDSINRVVEFEAWREHLYRRSPGVTPDTKRQHLKRAVTGLQAKGLIGFREPYVWVVPNA